MGVFADIAAKKAELHELGVKAQTDVLKLRRAYAESIILEFNKFKGKVLTDKTHTLWRIEDIIYSEDSQNVKVLYKVLNAEGDWFTCEPDSWDIAIFRNEGGGFKRYKSELELLAIAGPEFAQYFDRVAAIGGELRVALCAANVGAAL